MCRRESSNGNSGTSQRGPRGPGRVQFGAGEPCERPSEGTMDGEHALPVWQPAGGQGRSRDVGGREGGRPVPASYEGDAVGRDSGESGGPPVVGHLACGTAAAA